MDVLTKDIYDGRRLRMGSCVFGVHLTCMGE